jgi:LemA protein
MELLIFLAVFLLVPALFLVVQYNRFVALRQHIREAWSNVDTELKRRYDLIPNLVQTVQGYAAHEKAVLEQVIALRNAAAANQGATASQCQDEKLLVSGLQKLLAVVENYPDLKADQHFLRLQNELVQTEDRIQAARRFFNGNVRDYRTLRESFPTNLIASWFHFPPEDFFEVDPAIRNLPPTK